MKSSTISLIIGAEVVILLTSALLIPVIHSTSEESSLNIVILDGQSNAEYWPYSNNRVDPELVNETYPAPDHKVLYYGLPGNSSNQLLNINQCCVKSAYSDGRWEVGGFEAALGSELSNKFDSDVMIINLAVGGKSIAELLPGSPWGDWGIYVLNHALDEVSAQYEQINMCGVVWAQGEADHDTPVSNYLKSFDILIKNFKSYGATDWYIVHTREYYGGNATAAQDILSSKSYIKITSDLTESFTEAGGDLVLGDPIHYTQQGRDKIATELADLFEIPAQHESIPLVNIIPVVILVALIAAIAATIKFRND